MMLRPGPDFDRSVYCVLGLVVDAVAPAETAEILAAAIGNRRRCLLATPNMAWISLSLVDPVFRDTVLSSDLSLADGMPLVWAARLLGLPIRRVAGSDLFETLMEGAAGNLTVFFFGGPEGAARTACKRINGFAGAMGCAGFEYPGFGSVEQLSNPTVVQKINHANADIIGVSLGAEKGQHWIVRNEPDLISPIVWHWGAVVNFAAGTIRRSPAFLSRLGFEWLWRIKEEPKLWRRYAADLMTLTQFLIFRVFPCAVFQVVNRPSNADLMKAHLDVLRSKSLYTLRFSGPWTERNLGPVRDALRRTVEDPSDLVLDLEKLSYADAAFFGLIMIAYGYQRRMKRNFSVSSVNAKTQRIMRLHGCDFLSKP